MPYHNPDLSLYTPDAVVVEDAQFFWRHPERRFRLRLAATNELIDEDRLQFFDGGIEPTRLQCCVIVAKLGEALFVRVPVYVYEPWLHLRHDAGCEWLLRGADVQVDTLHLDRSMQGHFGMKGACSDD